MSNRIKKIFGLIACLMVFIIVINPSGKDVSVSLDYDKVVKKVIPILSCSKHKVIDYKNKQLKISAEPLSYGIYQIY